MDGFLSNPPRCLTNSNSVSSPVSLLLSARRPVPHRSAPHKCVYPNLALLKIVFPTLAPQKCAFPDPALLKNVFPNLALLKNVFPDLALLKNVFPNLALLKNVFPNLAPNKCAYPNPAPKTSKAAVPLNVRNVVEMPSTGGLEIEGRSSWGAL
ncbi:hypothetical protein L345_11796, partial [Ophiophagus hannah]